MRPVRSPLFFLCLSVLGCPAPDEPPIDDSGIPSVDADGDGYSENQDCADDDPEVHPGADERCDGMDNDCDGFVDDDDADRVGGESWWFDEDSDGFGAIDSEVVACERPEGADDQGGDCDDSDPTINPDKREECDGIDNNCDGEVDEDGALWTDTFYQDSDGDGFGDADSSREACDPGSGWVDDRGDCDDGDPAVYPGAPESVAGVDDDCDGLLDERPVSEAWAIVEAESAGDRAGRAVAGAGDADGDGRVDFFVGARGDDDGGTDAGAVYLVTGDDPGQRSLMNAEAKLVGTAGSSAGHALDGGVDVDGDGFADLLVGGPYDDSNAPDAGVAWLAFGPFEDGSLADAVPLMGLYDTDLAGWSVALLGDLDGDGAGEVVVGAPYGKHGTSSPGVAYLVGGAPRDGLVLHDSALRMVGESDYDGAGARVAAAGDLDGDGIEDLLVGASGLDQGATDTGAAYVLLGSGLASMMTSVTVLDLGLADGRHVGESRYDMAGYGLAGGGDVDGDGLDDVVVGAPYHDDGGLDAGAAYLIYGPATGSTSLADAPAKLLGAREGDSAGNAVAVASDVDGDGRAELLLGAPVYEDGLAEGWVALWTEQPSGVLDLAEAPWIMQGEQPGDYLGFALAGPGDMDGDGLGDLLLGAPLSDSADTEAGAVVVVFGP